MPAYPKKSTVKADYITPPEDFSPYSIGNIITVNKNMVKIMNLAKRISVSEAPVLITGHSGVGKELLAEFIHSNSKRKEKAFIKLNCAAIPHNLMESEFFGYESGSFTGASRNGKKGLIELAEKGTLFLDEIGEMPLDMQSKLLRVLQDGKFLKIGGKKEVKADIRILAATNQEITKMISKKLFREDLYFRLNVIPICILPLCERKDDISILALYYLNHFNKLYNTSKVISADVMEELVDYSWPGNIRELKNVIERLVLITLEDKIKKQDLLYSSFASESHDASGQIQISDLEGAQSLSLRQMVEEYEINIITQAIKKYGSIRKAAAALKVPPSTICRKLANHNKNPQV